jgi:hypothetical protein
MFDPERDEEHDSRRFLWRLLIVATATVALCAVLYPSVTGFAAGSDHQIECIAMKNGWHRDRTMSDADVIATFAALPKPPPGDQLRDPVVAQQWRAELHAAQALPAVQRADAALDWADGPGACVPESRHRLIISAIGLGVLLAALAGAWIVIRTRKNLRRTRTDAELDAGSVGNALA